MARRVIYINVLSRVRARVSTLFRSKSLRETYSGAHYSNEMPRHRDSRSASRVYPKRGCLIKTRRASDEKLIWSRNDVKQTIDVASPPLIITTGAKISTPRVARAEILNEREGFIRVT